MLRHPTVDQLHQLGLLGMARALEELRNTRDADALGFEERLALLIERETAWRDTKRTQARLRRAKLRQDATVEDVDYRTPRGLDRALFQRLAGGQWIAEHQNLLITGPCGVGKSWLACALTTSDRPACSTLRGWKTTSPSDRMTVGPRLRSRFKTSIAPGKSCFAKG